MLQEMVLKGSVCLCMLCACVRANDSKGAGQEAGMSGRGEAVVGKVVCTADLTHGEGSSRLAYSRHKKKIPMPTQLETHLPDTGTVPTGSCPGWGTGLQSRSHLLLPGMPAAPDTGLGGIHGARR